MYLANSSMKLDLSGEFGNNEDVKVTFDKDGQVIKLM